LHPISLVSHTSPINKLAAINQLHLLHQLYGTVLIPEAVFREITDPSFPVAGATEVKTLDWIQTRAVSERTLVEALSNESGIGECHRAPNYYNRGSLRSQSKHLGCIDQVRRETILSCHQKRRVNYLSKLQSRLLSLSC